MEAWPSISETTFALTLSPSSSVAQVWRRSWKRRSSRTPARALIRLKERLRRLEGLNREPVSLGKTRPLSSTWKAHRECFDEAASRFDPPFEKVEISYEDTTLPGYLFKVDNSERIRPLLILNNGSDGPVSAMYLQG